MLPKRPKLLAAYDDLLPRADVVIFGGLRQGGVEC